MEGKEERSDERRVERSYQKETYEIKAGCSCPTYTKGQITGFSVSLSVSLSLALSLSVCVLFCRIDLRKSLHMRRVWKRTLICLWQSLIV